MLRSRPHALPSLRRISSPSSLFFLPSTRSLSTSSSSLQPKQPTKEPLPSTLPPPRLDYRPLLNRTALQGLIFNSNFRNSTLPESHFHTASKLASRRTSLNERIVSLRTARNAISARLKERDPTATVDEAKRIKTELLALEPELQSVEKELLKLVVVMPNDTHGEVPIGPEENAVELERIGPEELVEHDANRDHLIVGRELGIVDFESAAQVSGAGFYYLKGAGVILEQAIQSYALSIAVKHGFEPVACPDVVRTDMAARCGFVPRDSDGSSQSYHIASSSSSSDESSSMPLSLAGTAEIPLAGSFFNKLFPQGSLPKRLVGTGHAFRTEAGNGKEVRGLYRVHQFSKVELFVACEEGQSEREMEGLRDLQREIVQGLGLSVRVLDMPSEELGASAHRKYDMEAWMPGRGSWGEISSTSNCTSYQARRLLTTYRPSPPPFLSPRSPSSDPSSSSSPPTPTRFDPTPLFAHTLNGTAAAIPRLLIALLESGVILSPPTNPSSSPPRNLSPGQVKDELRKRQLRPGERQELLDLGVEVLGVRLPECLRRFWIGQELVGGKEIVWV